MIQPAKINFFKNIYNKFEIQHSILRVKVENMTNFILSSYYYR